MSSSSRFGAPRRDVICFILNATSAPPAAVTTREHVKTITHRPRDVRRSCIIFLFILANVRFLGLKMKIFCWKYPNARINKDQPHRKIMIITFLKQYLNICRARAGV